MLRFHILSSLAMAAVDVTICVAISALPLSPFGDVLSQVFDAGRFLHWFADNGEAECGVAFNIRHYFGFLYLHK